MLDESEVYIKELSNTIINLYKLCIEDMGYDMGDTNNEIEYRNYLVDEPIEFITGGGNADVSTDLDHSNLGLTGGDPGDTGLSDGMLNFICKYETSHSFGYTMGPKDLNGIDLGDAHGHKTFGYGLLVHPNGKYMDSIKSSWGQDELENLFKTHAKSIMNKINAWTSRNSVALNQNQKDAIASACYNFGFGFLQKQICKIIAANPNNPTIRNTWSHLSDIQGKKYPGLIKRRQAEARWYFEGK
jgi:GH24 family phage-related lysozyme (muramidase)